MERLVRRIDLTHSDLEKRRDVMRREWLLTNGLGGYASGTISGSVTRRYHGLLVAALPAPLGRVVMLNHLAEHVRLADARVIPMAGEEPIHAEDGLVVNHCATEFRLENQIPVWRFDVDGHVIEKRVLLVHGQNTVHVQYRLLSGADTVQLEVRPSVHFRRHEHDVSSHPNRDYLLTIGDNRYEIADGPEYPALRLKMVGEAMTFTHDPNQREIGYLLESERGYPSRGHLWSPGFFSITLRAGSAATLIGSTEPWKIINAMSPAEAMQADAERRRRLVAMARPEAQNGPAAELVLAADQFIITPAGRIEDTARAKAAGDEIRTVIAGYHWFTDWGRDTMISLEGLTLSTGRCDEAGWILRTFAHYIRDGLIPNFFPDGENEGLYHTADATLWFFHALHRYLQATKDDATLSLILPKLVDVAEHHLRGTHYGIGVDTSDHLLRQGKQGYQLTWMDAKVEDWVVTPRRGKAVEINALWYNALRLLQGWLRDAGEEELAAKYGGEADLVGGSFNERFWNAKTGCLFDVIDGEEGNDPACRPNQILSISLDHPVLDPQRWDAVLRTVREQLLTPLGLRTLSRDHRDYKAKYFGDLRARDAAYHQGTVWAWLLGPFVDAWLKVHPEDCAGARRWLDGLMGHLDEACIGSISEIFDAESPFTARGCIAQAWSVAEALRCWVKTAEQPDGRSLSRDHVAEPSKLSSLQTSDRQLTR